MEPSSPETQALLGHLAESALRPLDRARGLPAELYRSEDVAALERDRIFRQDWVCPGLAAEIPNHGDYLTFSIAGEAVFCTRTKAGEIKTFANVCRHRMMRLLEGRGSARKIICPYHAWTYNLDGSLRGAPAMTLNEGFCKDSYKLPQVRCQEWLGWAFVSLNPDAPDVADQLAQVEELVGDYDMANYTETFFETHVWDTNWKVLAENFMESYHLPVCHAGTIGGLSKLEEMDCPPGLPAFNYHTILKDDTLKIALAHPENTRMTGERRRTTYLLAIYPSLLITLTPGYFWYLSLHPEGVGKVRISFGGGMSQDWVDDADAQEHFKALKTLLDDVNIEDRGCTEKVYNGLCSQMAAPGHLSHLERPNYDFATYLNTKIQAGNR